MEGHAKDPAIGGANVTVKINETTKIPMLDLSIIYFQQAENEEEEQKA